MDNETYMLTVAATKAISGSAGARAEAAAQEAEASALAAQEAADSVSTATLAEAKEYLGITT